MPTPFPTNSRKANFTVIQEDMASDLNSISTYLHQIIKDRNVNFVINTQEGFLPGCIVNGCVPSLEVQAPYVSVSMGSGLILFSPPVDTDNYSGSLLPITGGKVGSVLLPTAGKYVMYGLDITYSEVLDTGNQSPRNFYYAPKDLVSAKNSPIYKVPTSSFSLVPSSEVQDPSTLTAPAVATGYTRIATFILSSTGIYQAPVVSIPYIWNLENWPGSPAVPHNRNSMSTKTLADCLSAIRAQLASLTAGHWYTGPAIDLKTLKTSIDTAQSTVDNIILGFKGMSVLNAGFPSTYEVPPGCNKLYIRMWGPGGKGGNGRFAQPQPGKPGNTIRAWGGGGGAGAYIEDVLSVTPGQTISYRVGSGGSGNPTTFGSYSAGAGGNGGDASITGTQTSVVWYDGPGGSGGIPIATSTTAVLIPGESGSKLGYGDGRASANMPCIDYFNRQGKATPTPLYGCGGGGCAGGWSSGVVWPPIVNSPGGIGGDGIIIVYFA